MPGSVSCRFITLPRRFVTAISLLTLLAACGGSGSETGPPSGPVVSKADPSGDDQAGRVGAVLPDPIRVIVTDAGKPVAGTAVTWQVVSGGGSVDPPSALSDASGVVAATVTLGATPGEMKIQADAGGAAGGPLPFSAFAAGPAVSVQVTNNIFDPLFAAVTAGGTVSFVWPAGSLQHNIVPDGAKDRPNAAAVMDGPFSIDVVFPTAGSYPYYCSVHGAPGTGMHGTIVVVP
jgi:plastocyanin